MEKDCSNFLKSIQPYKGQDLYEYMILSCQLEIMGIHTVDYMAIPDFMGPKFVSRAEFGTVLSRLLRGDRHEGTDQNYYINHLQALQDYGIMNQIDNPEQRRELRQWARVMLMRSFQNVREGDEKNKDPIIL